MKLPPGWLVWGGQSRTLSGAATALFRADCFAPIFLLLLGSFGSARRALVYSAVPLALTGGVLPVAARHDVFDLICGRLIAFRASRFSMAS
jgi:Cu/Ag efflux pump CusA